MAQKITMLMLGVNSLEESVPFYRDRLGFELQHRHEGLAFFAAGGITLLLSEPLAKAVQPRSGAVEVIIGAESVTGVHASLREAGLAFLKEPHEVTSGMWAATLRDPDGHMLTFYGAK